VYAFNLRHWYWALVVTVRKSLLALGSVLLPDLPMIQAGVYSLFFAYADN
jgi:hypothetical protein